jgi:hypothetical protein
VLDQCCLINAGATRSIDQHRIGLHHSEALLVHEVACVVVKVAVQADHLEFVKWKSYSQDESVEEAGMRTWRNKGCSAGRPARHQEQWLQQQQQQQQQHQRRRPWVAAAAALSTVCQVTTCNRLPDASTQQALLAAAETFDCLC